MRQQEKRKNDAPQNRLERNEERGTTNAVDKAHHPLEVFVDIHHRRTGRSPSLHPLASASQMPPDIRIGQREYGKQSRNKCDRKNSFPI